MNSIRKASNYIPKTPEHIECNIEKTLDVLGGKWAFLVIRELFGGDAAFWGAAAPHPASEPAGVNQYVASSGGEGRTGADGVSYRSRDSRIYTYAEGDGFACDLS